MSRISIGRWWAGPGIERRAGDARTNDDKIAIDVRGRCHAFASSLRRARPVSGVPVATTAGALLSTRRSQLSRQNSGLLRGQFLEQTPWQVTPFNVTVFDIVIVYLVWA